MDHATRLRWIASHILPHEGEVRGWLRRHVRSLTSSDADDLIQEAYARLWLGDFTHIENPRSYFYATVRNLMLEHARRARIVPMERLGEIESLRIPSEEPGPERLVTARQELERLMTIVESLPEQCQRAFRLQKFQGYSQREIADEMGITEKTVEKHLATALMKVLKTIRGQEGEVYGTNEERSGHDSRSISD